MQRSRRVWGLVRAEFGQPLRLRTRRLVGRGGSNAPSIPTARLVQRTVFFLLLLVALTGAQARSALADPTPDPHPSATKSPEAPTPDPAPDASPTRTAPSRATPDASSSAAPPSSSTSVEPRTTAQAPAPAPTPTPTFTPPRTTTPKSRTSTAKPKSRATRPGRGSEAVAAPQRGARNEDRQRVEPIVAAVTDRANGRGLLLGGLGMLALALASGGLLFLVARAGGWETRT